MTLLIGTYDYKEGLAQSDPEFFGAASEHCVEVISAEMDDLLSQGSIYRRLPRDPLIVTVTGRELRGHESLLHLADADGRGCGALPFKEFDRTYEGLAIEGVDAPDAPKAYIARMQRVRAIPNPNGLGMLLARFEPMDDPGTIRRDRFVLSDQEFESFHLDDEYEAKRVEHLEGASPKQGQEVPSELVAAAELIVAKAAEATDGVTHARFRSAKRLLATVALIGIELFTFRGR